MRIILAAGGTGGHIVPAIAVADALRELQPKSEIVFIGTGRDLEKRLVSNAGYQLQSLPAAPLLGGGLIRIARYCITIPKGIVGALRYFRETRPAVVVGFGGYPAVAPVLAAWLLRIPIVLHESNVAVGAATKFLSLFAKKVLAVSGAQGFPRGTRFQELPNPVRKKFYSVKEWTAPKEGTTVLVVGGSQGAVSLNDGIAQLMQAFRDEKVRLIHQTGATDFERMKERYQRENFQPEELTPFIDDMPAALERAHLVISRSGAMSVAETMAAGRPAIFVPLPIAGGHQKANALPAEQSGAAKIVEHGTEFATKLRQEVSALLGSPSRLESMSRAARKFSQAGSDLPAARIARVILETV